MKASWFRLIENGQKRVELRSVGNHWAKRIRGASHIRFTIGPLTDMAFVIIYTAQFEKMLGTNSP